jgi:hypothetical protein
MGDCVLECFFSIISSLAAIKPWEAICTNLLQECETLSVGFSFEHEVLSLILSLVDDLLNHGFIMLGN